LLATGTDTGHILLWDVAAGRLLTRLAGHRGRVASVDFSPDGKRLVSGRDDTTILVWGHPGSCCQPGTIEFGAAGKGTRVAVARVRVDGRAASIRGHREATASAPGGRYSVAAETVPVKEEDVAQVRAWIDDLESDKFKVRETATAALAKLGEFAEHQLEKVLTGNPTLEMRHRVEVLLHKLNKPTLSPQRLQQERALLVLQWVRTAEAKRLLEALAQGAPEAWLTQQAKAACRRLVE
jgi:hypothetical protein